MVKIEKQYKFPFIRRFKKKFPITDDTIFVYKDTIYSNKTEEDWKEFYDVYYHELRHLYQQRWAGARKWIKYYLKDDDFRLEQEIDAYREQLKKVRETGDREEYAHILQECAGNISSPLYGNIISYQEALKKLCTT